MAKIPGEHTYNEVHDIRRKMEVGIADMIQGYLEAFQMETGHIIDDVVVHTQHIKFVGGESKTKCSGVDMTVRTAPRFIRNEG